MALWAACSGLQMRDSKKEKNVLERRGVAVECNRDLGVGLEFPLKLDAQTPDKLPREKQVMARLCQRWREDFVPTRLRAAPGTTRLHGLLQLDHQKKRAPGAVGGLFDCATALPNPANGVSSFLRGCCTATTSTTTTTTSTQTTPTTSTTAAIIPASRAGETGPRTADRQIQIIWPARFTSTRVSCHWRRWCAAAGSRWRRCSALVRWAPRP